MVGLGVVGHSLLGVVAVVGIGEAVDCAAVEVDLVIDLALLHFLDELVDFFEFDEGVEVAGTAEDLALDVLRVFGGGGGEAAVEGDDAQYVGAAAGQFQRGGAAEAVADGGDLLRVDFLAGS